MWFSYKGQFTCPTIADTHIVLAGNVLPLRLCQGYGLELVPAVNPHNGYLNTESASVRPPVTTKAHQQQQADATSRCQKLEEEASTSDLTHVTSNQLMPHSAPHAESFPAGAPSLVGATYMGVQGAQQISVGATKQFGLSPEEALQECGRGVTDPGEVAQAEGLLRPKAEGLWSPAASWQVNPLQAAETHLLTAEAKFADSWHFLCLVIICIITGACRLCQAQFEGNGIV